MGLSGIALVTGGAGFIGSHIASALVASGARVRILDDLSTGHRENVEEIGGDIDFVRGSVADEALLRRVLDGVELVFHEAAIPSVPRSVDNPRQTHTASVDGTFSLLVAARERKVRRLDLCGFEFSIWGSADTTKIRGMSPDPLSPYAVAKLVGEYYAEFLLGSMVLKPFPCAISTFLVPAKIQVRSIPVSFHFSSVPCQQTTDL